MIYYVSMQQSDVPFSFTTVFSREDAFAILSARVGEQVDLDRGAFGTLLSDGDFILTTRSAGGGKRMQSLNYAELCRQLSDIEDDDGD